MANRELFLKGVMTYWFGRESDITSDDSCINSLAAEVHSARPANSGAYDWFVVFLVHLELGAISYV